MTTLIQAAEQALKAMEESHPEAYRHAITALRQAIALEKMAENERELGIQMQPDEPSVTVWRHSRTGHIRVTTPGDITDCDAQWVNVTDQYLSPKPADEPVARVVGYYAGRCVIEPLDRAMVMPDNMALYAHPQPKREWVGLTEKEKREARNSVSYSPLAMTMSEWTEAVQDATEAKLKEKNHG